MTAIGTTVAVGSGLAPWQQAHGEQRVASDGVGEGTSGDKEDATPTITPTATNADYHLFEVMAAGDPRPLHASHIKVRLPKILVTTPKQNPVTLHLQLSCFHGGGESVGLRSGAKTSTGSGIGAWVQFGVEGSGNFGDLGSMGEDMVGWGARKEEEEKGGR
ncbi:long chain acyl-CoA synthetase 1 [Pyrus ussuriensis x Pyrus communis]|uniref:Long chain acyl-CoA synthetase 1 n=1 Tax=Pyrus ussuriensis x Pyrus communis TaxID=2448454 RepID=A0A5N5H629_9ROSA|nr:long chain acyl-CoA synthetase 1 [Pyrus ussuriensis x Pyrus communis]